MKVTVLAPYPESPEEVNTLSYIQACRDAKVKGPMQGIVQKGVCDRGMEVSTMGMGK